MRAKFRDLPRFSGRGWLALPLIVPWAVLAVFFWICAGVWIVARFATQQAQRGWRALQSRRAS
jgi:hypothetical protein